MLRFFQSFLGKMKANFQRIARATRNELTAEDLQQEAWLIAQEIGDKRGRPIDFSDPADQELIIKAVNHRNVKRGDWQMRRSFRIDAEAEGEDGTMTWTDRLQAQASSDPLISLLLKESAQDADSLLVSSYSQATAYVMVFVHFKNSREEVCSYLVISGRTLSRRVAVAADSVRVQPSLFDRLERISSSFLPPPGKQYAVRAAPGVAGTQWGWEF